MSIALDYTTRIAPAALRAAGVTDVCRYLSWPHYWAGRTHTEVNPKIIGQTEFAELLDAGVGVTLNWEYAAVDWASGTSGAQAHAAEAVRQAEELGYPRGCTIVGSADFNMSREQWLSNARAYAITWRDRIDAAGYRPGVYGPYDVLTWCRDEVGIDMWWQAGMSTSWSAGRNAKPWPGVHLRQRGHLVVGGVDADWNEIAVPDWGQYRKDTADMLDGYDQHYPDGVTRAEGLVLKELWTALAWGQTAGGAPMITGRIADDVTAVRAAVNQMAVAGVDLDALAAKVATQLETVIATVVADELAKRLGNG